MCQKFFPKMFEIVTINSTSNLNLTYKNKLRKIEYPDKFINCITDKRLQIKAKTLEPKLYDMFLIIINLFCKIYYFYKKNYLTTLFGIIIRQNDIYFHKIMKIN